MTYIYQKDRYRSFFCGVNVKALCKLKHKEEMYFFSIRTIFYFLQHPFLIIEHKFIDNQNTVIYSSHFIQN